MTLVQPAGRIIEAYCAKYCAKSSGRSVTIADRSSNEVQRNFLSNSDCKRFEFVRGADASPDVDFANINVELD